MWGNVVPLHPVALYITTVGLISDKTAVNVPITILCTSEVMSFICRWASYFTTRCRPKATKLMLYDIAATSVFRYCGLPICYRCVGGGDKTYLQDHAPLLLMTSTEPAVSM